MIQRTLFCIYAIWITYSIGMTQKEAMDYLAYYGYMTDSNESDFRNCLMKFQKVASIPMTGEMDAMTNKMMEKPRCGCSDNIKMGTTNYSIQGSKWRINRIKYSIECAPHIKQLVHTSLSRAFKEWSEYSKIDFSQGAPEESLLHISFGPLERKEELANAAFPIFGGNITFNEKVKWTDGQGDENQTMVNLYEIALHEIGHSLGLGHSMIESAVMYSFHDPTVSKVHLMDEDIEGISILYNH